MLGTRFWNNFIFREYDYFLEEEDSQFHLDGDGWYEPDFNYYYIGNGYYDDFKKDYDVNCIYEINKI